LTTCTAAAALHRSTTHLLQKRHSQMQLLVCHRSRGHAPNTRTWCIKFLKHILDKKLLSSLASSAALVPARVEFVLHCTATVSRGRFTDAEDPRKPTVFAPRVDQSSLRVVIGGVRQHAAACGHAQGCCPRRVINFKRKRGSSGLHCTYRSKGRGRRLGCHCYTSMTLEGKTFRRTRLPPVRGEMRENCVATCITLRSE
jgi:hypothetical protein